MVKSVGGPNRLHPTHRPPSISAWFLYRIYGGITPIFVTSVILLQAEVEPNRQSNGKPECDHRFSTFQSGQILGMAVRATPAQTRSSGSPTRRKSRKR